jgi:hypothetical protein
MGDIVTLTVTDNGGAKAFTVPRALACEHSPYLRAALEEGNGNAQCVELSDTTKSAVSLLSQWFRTSKIRDRNYNLPPLTTLISLYLLASTLQIPALQNAAVEALNKECVHRGVVLTHCLIDVFKRTQPGDGLRRLLVDQVALTMTAEGMTKDLAEKSERYTFEILGEIVMAMKKGCLPRILEVENYLVPVVGGRAEKVFV